MDTAQDIRLRRLEGRACLDARPLWEEVFSEDSREFTEYYFSYKAAKNRGLVLEGADGLRAMLYLTPERMRVKGQSVDAVYIVGVATRRPYRHRGYMARLLREGMTALAREGMPFAFLMPASPAIYAPFGFVWIYERPVWDAGTLRRERLTEMGEKDAKRLALFAAEFLEKEKAVYVCRDAAYYRLQAKELAAQHGGILGYERNGRLCGICMYTQEEGLEIPEVLAEAEAEAAFVCRRPEHKPAIMARILCVETMLGLVRYEGKADFMLAVSDPLVAQNNAFFHCQCGAETEGKLRCVRKAAPENGIPLISADIGELTSAVFGYRSPNRPALQKIEPLSPVWINEIV